MPALKVGGRKKNAQNPLKFTDIDRFDVNLLLLSSKREN